MTGARYKEAQNIFWAYIDEVPQPVKEVINELFNEVKKYQDTIEFYAEPKHWVGSIASIPGKIFHPSSDSAALIPDCGRRARKALGA